MGAVFLLVVSLSAQPSRAWIATGHKVIAMIAWEDLTPKTRAAVTAILKQHPRFEKDLQAGADDGASDDAIALHAFAQAATWPDMVRLQEHPMHAEYNHPSWHYIDIPYIVGNAAPAPEKAPTTTTGPHNIVEALAQCVAELKDPKTPPARQAVDLCWVEHLVGDIHQPLHAATLVSAEYPNGDQGGNGETVLREPPYPDSQANLHFIWDALPGDFMSDALDSFEAKGLRGDARYSRDMFKDLLPVTDFMAWAKESHALAVKDVYLDGRLKTAETPKGRRFSSDPVPGLPPGYLEHAEKVAMHQVSLSGYRLADLLNATFDPK